MPADQNDQPAITLEDSSFNSPIQPPAPQATQPTSFKLPHKTPRRKWLIIITVLVIIIGASSVVLFWPKKNKNSQPTVLTKVSVQLEWVNNPEFAGMYVAKDLGYYRAAGLDVELRELQETTNVNEEVASGKADFGVSTPLEIILARDKGQKTKAIAAIYQTSAYSIVSPKTADIKTPSDLKGKILGSGGGNNQALVTYRALMTNAGLEPSQATIKEVGFDPVDVFTKKQANTYDIYRTDQTYLLDKAGIPYNQIFPEQYGFAIYGDVLSASDTKITKNPDQVSAFTQATLKGWQYAINHQPETLTILARHANELYKEPAYLKYVQTNTSPLIKPTGSQLLGSMQYVSWNRAYQGVEASGLLKTKLNVSDIYTSEFVR
jgi:ABC-type nitrate/sulfonate/bicarbonate transport system substrate-binding protein